MLFFSIIFYLSTIFIPLEGNNFNQGDLVLKLSKLQNKKGKILINIFSSEKGFPDDEKKSFKFWVEDPKEEIILKNIPPGNYALSLLHDEDGNFKMTYNFFKFPREGFAFSNFDASIFNLPKFEEAKFEHKKNGTVLHLKVIY
jgi:uncharacterized protein (DUF2141 family)